MDAVIEICDTACERAEESTNSSTTNPPAMNPPAYSPGRTIHDLRVQIIANGTILKPRADPNRAADNHIELIMAKWHSNAPSVISPVLEKQKHFSEKQRPASTTTTSTLPESSSATDGKHYAVLIVRSYSKQDIRILIKGEPKDTIEEALEWMLDATEKDVHSLVVKFGRAERETCAVM
ncbi:hypothetical protein LTR17_012903 [Elasticomyces elasticus]|nr:hypothetical protein LTR17_012903 [Elasticomyces elasticus]